MIPFDKFSFVSQHLLAAPWRFAKTMPHNPHHYTLRKTWKNDDDFVEVVKTMREYGYTEYYRGRPYTMFNVNDCKYWTMGAPIQETILINRKVISTTSAYDKIADVYDTLFVDEESKAENDAVFDMIPESDNVLDVGCGTGLFLEYRSPLNYLGIDPSRAMINRLKAKFPGADTMCAKFEDFYGGKYDLIVSLFGSACYIAPDALSRIPLMLTPNGSYFLMFYQPDYFPVTYRKLNIVLPHFMDGHLFVSGKVQELNNFLIVTGP